MRREAQCRAASYRVGAAIDERVIRDEDDLDDASDAGGHDKARPNRNLTERQRRDILTFWEISPGYE